MVRILAEASITPLWVNVVVSVAAIMGAVGVLWRTVLRPIQRLVSLGTALLPLMTDLVDVMADTRTPWSVLNEIIAEFRTDSGSSLRDAVDRIEHATHTAATAAKTAQTAVEQNQQQMAGLAIQVDGIAGKQQQIIAEMTKKAADPRTNLPRGGGD